MILRRKHRGSSVSKRSEGVPIPPASVAAIIPAHNEAGRIGCVLSVVCQVQAITEIIVVDDGSSDNTSQEAFEAAGQDPRLHIICHPTNLGKGEAMFTGRQATRAEYLVFLDADLINLTPEHVESLILPLLYGQADMTLGLFRQGQMTTDLAHWMTPWLTGQRGMRAELFDRISPDASAGYGVETAITVAASRYRWRTHRVALRGVSHPSSEFHRGVWNGVKNRARMYAQITRAWRKAGGWQLFLARITPRVRLFLLLLLLLAGSMAYNRSIAASGLVLNDLQPLLMENYQRVLVISPHPDDETIAAGGLIRAALAKGKQVRVMIVTNGDGQLLAPLAMAGRVRARAIDYIQMGERRQDETLAALNRLGLTGQQVDFLGYPDRGIEAMWLGDWQTGCPLRARYTHSTASAYPLTFNSRARYCGIDLLNDIETIITAYRPDLIIIPHPNDEHSDHRAVSNFARLAVTLESAQDPNYRPLTLEYLVHYGYFPQPRGYHPTKPLLPPQPLSGNNNTWYRLDLSDQQIKVKEKAISRYLSQARLLGSFLPSFARANEMFAESPLLEMPLARYTNFPLAESGMVHLPDLAEPAEESARRFVIGGADLIGWEVTRLGRYLWLTADTRGPQLPGLSYRLLIKTPDGHTLQTQTDVNSKLLKSSSFSARVDLDELGNPSVLGFAAEVRQGIPLDGTAWRFVLLRDTLP